MVAYTLLHGGKNGSEGAIHFGDRRSDVSEADVNKDYAAGLLCDIDGWD